MKKKISKVFWYCETESRFPDLGFYDGIGDANNAQIVVDANTCKPSKNGKRLRITIEEI